MRADSAALESGECTIAAGASPASNGATAAICARPCADNGTSLLPWKRIEDCPSVSP
jgi:hypothetical protein